MNERTKKRSMKRNFKEKLTTKRKRQTQTHDDVLILSSGRNQLKRSLARRLTRHRQTHRIKCSCSNWLLWMVQRCSAKKKTGNFYLVRLQCVKHTHESLMQWTKRMKSNENVDFYFWIFRIRFGRTLTDSIPTINTISFSNLNLKRIFFVVVPDSAVEENL